MATSQALNTHFIGPFCSPRPVLTRFRLTGLSIMDNRLSTTCGKIGNVPVNHDEFTRFSVKDTGLPTKVEDNVCCAR